MATHGQRITLEEYLRTSYRPDMEFLNGYLGEKPMGTWDHGRIQALLVGWFLRHEREWRVQVVVEMRTQTSATQVRLPDVVLDWAGPHPPVLVEAPLLVIEVLSPTDSYSELHKRAKDYLAMGTRNIWLIEPESRTAQACEGTTWVERERLEIPETPIYLDVPALFRALDAGEPL